MLSWKSVEFRVERAIEAAREVGAAVSAGRDQALVPDMRLLPPLPDERVTVIRAAATREGWAQ